MGRVDGPWVLAMDIGGTLTRAALVNAKGQLTGRREIYTQAWGGCNTLIERAICLAQETKKESTGQILSVGVGAPGPVDPETGLLIYAPNLPDCDNVPLRKHLEQALSLPVHLGNDANVAVLAEWRWGYGQGLDHIVYLTISTGVGGGIITDGHLLLGHRGLGGELGHIVVEPNGPRCVCGGRGCLAAVASGRALAQKVQSLADSGASPYLARKREKLSVKDLVGAAEAGDSASQQILDRAGRGLGIAMSSILNLFAPQIIVLGGGVLLGLGAWLLEPAQDWIESYANPFHRDIPFVITDFRENAGLLGAAALAWEAALPHLKEKCDVVTDC